VAPSTPARARQFATTQLHDVFGDDPQVLPVIDDAVLAISELVTNAVNAQATTVTVELTIHHDHLQLAVFDDADGQPELQSPSPHATGGRGLRIIERVGRGWGTRPGPGGKQIWVELALDPRSTVALECTR
jgi:signal transduction histidine kinase